MRIFYGFASLLTVIFLLQLLQLFLSLHSVNPLAAYILAGCIGAVIIVTLLVAWLKLVKYPRALKCPDLPALEDATKKDLQHYCSYLNNFMKRLSTNESLSDESRTRINELNLSLSKNAGRSNTEELKTLISTAEQEGIIPALEELKVSSSKEIRGCVRDVMLAVTFSPYQSVDMLVVMYRNLAMVMRIISIYSSRPRIREQWAIIHDVFKVVVTVNFIAAGRNLLESLCSHLPFLGKVVDDMAQGLGAGYLTSVAGYAATDRCMAFKGWSQQEAERHLTANAKTFLSDVRDIFTKDVLPSLKTKIKISAPKEISDQPGFWDSIGDGVNKAIDTTVDTTDFLIVKPVAFTGQTIGKGVTATTSGIKGIFNYLNIFKS